MLKELIEWCEEQESEENQKGDAEENWLEDSAHYARASAFASIIDKIKIMQWG